MYRDFGDFRSRCSCETLARLLASEKRLRLSGGTVRRGLHLLGFVWRRPLPVLGQRDPEFTGEFQAIQRLLGNRPADEAAVFQDEVDVHLIPKIGSMWMKQGEQPAVATPGNHRQCHVAGSWMWSTGTLPVSTPQPRCNTAQVLTHLDDLCCRLAEQNEHPLNWEETVADTRIHGTTKKQVRRQFETAERSALLPLPRDRFAIFQEARRTVSRDGRLEVDKAFYLAPPEYVTRRVWVLWDARLVLDGNRCIGCHLGEIQRRGQSEIRISQGQTAKDMRFLIVILVR